MKPVLRNSSRSRSRRASLVNTITITEHREDANDGEPDKVLIRNIVDKAPLSPLQELPDAADPSDKRILDIEACIDHPHLAPLGDHVKPEVSKQILSTTTEPERPTKEPLTDNIIFHNTLQSSAFETSAALLLLDPGVPKTSLYLRRRHLNTAELEHHIAQFMIQTSPITFVHLSELDLSRNRITALPINIVTLAPHLRTLNLSSNLLSNFPPELLEFTELEVLLLSQNKIAGPMPEELPLRLSQLCTLRLDANAITDLPDTISNWKHLRQLILGSVFGGNRISSIPEGCISEMVELVELSVSHNLLHHLPSDLGHSLSQLRSLSAVNNQLESIPCTIGLCRSLRSLNLSHNHLTSLPEDLVDLRELDTLDVSSNLLCILPDNVLEHMSKTTILLTGNPFTQSGTCDIRAAQNQDNSYANLIRQLAKRAVATRVEYESAGDRSTTGTTTPLEDDARIDHHLFYQAQQHNVGLSPRPSTPLVGSYSVTPHPTSPSNTPHQPIEQPHSLNLTSLPDFSSFSSDPTTPTPDLTPSLRELAARLVISHSIPIPSAVVPASLMNYLFPGARPCAYCPRSYVKEWVSSIQVKAYRGHPAVVRRVRFCSAQCWREFVKENEREAEHGALEVKDGQGPLGGEAIQGHERNFLSPPAKSDGLLQQVLTKSAAARALTSPSPPCGLTPSLSLTTGEKESSVACLYKPVIAQAGRYGRAASRMARAACNVNTTLTIHSLGFCTRDFSSVNYERRTGIYGCRWCDGQRQMSPRDYPVYS
ncbi:hypothetical protein BC937DRAFT_91547, partial [Endogone sp. FLAS-F59071]